MRCVPCLEPRIDKRRPSAWATLALLVLGGTVLCAGSARADDDACDAPAAETEETILELGSEVLRLRLPPCDNLQRRAYEPDSQLRLRMRGDLGAVKMEILLRAYPRGRFDMNEPVDVLTFAEKHRWSDAGPGARRGTEIERTYLEGSYGLAPYLAVAKRRFTSSAGVGLIVLAGGLVNGYAYAVDMTLEGNVDGDAEAVVDEFLAQGITSPVESWDREWSDEEVEARWEKDAPGIELRRVIRTKHYIVLTNSSSGKLFAKKMEKNYEYIRKMLPFEEVPHARLMPVLLFRMPEEYHAFYRRISGKPLYLVQRSKGHAWRDYYATYYASPNDPVHIHEAVHQLVKGRLRLCGGGSWYQEGLAEYVENKKHQWNLVKVWAKKAARRGGYVPLRKFVEIPSLLDFSAEGGDDRYKQAASLIGFLRDGKFKREKFDEFLVRIGTTPDDRHDELIETIEGIYGVSMEELQERWLTYWKRGGR